MQEHKKALAASPLTAEKWRQASYYSDPSIVEAELADLKKMGLPEK